MYPLRKKQIISDIQIVSKGFVFQKPTGDLLEELKEQFIKTSQKHLSSKYINWTEYKKDVRNDISKIYLSRNKKKSNYHSGHHFHRCLTFNVFNFIN